MKCTPYYVYGNGDANHLTTEQVKSDTLRQSTSPWLTFTPWLLLTKICHIEFLPSHSSDDTSHEGMGKVFQIQDLHELHGQCLKYST
jgi:hypothetical protein